MGYLTTLFKNRKVKIQPTFKKEQSSSTYAAGAIAIMPKLVSVHMLVVSEQCGLEPHYILYSLIFVTACSVAMKCCSTDLSQNKITELLVSVVDELTLHKP